MEINRTASEPTLRPARQEQPLEGNASAAREARPQGHFRGGVSRDAGSFSPEALEALQSRRAGVGAPPAEGGREAFGHRPGGFGGFGGPQHQGGFPGFPGAPGGQEPGRGLADALQGAGLSDEQIEKVETALKAAREAAKPQASEAGAQKARPDFKATLAQALTSAGLSEEEAAAVVAKLPEPPARRPGGRFGGFGGPRNDAFRQALDAKLQAAGLPTQEEYAAKLRELGEALAAEQAPADAAATADVQADAQPETAEAADDADETLEEPSTEQLQALLADLQASES